MNLINIFLNSLIKDNVVLTKFVGLNYIHRKVKERTYINLGLSLTITSLISSIIVYILNLFLPSYLLPIVSILAIILSVFIIKNVSKLSDKLCQIYNRNINHILLNGACMAIVVFGTGFSFIEMIVYAIGSGLGYTLIIFLIATLQEQMEDVPLYLKGNAIIFILVGLISIVVGRIWKNLDLILSFYFVLTYSSGKI